MNEAESSDEDKPSISNNVSTGDQSYASASEGPPSDRGSEAAAGRLQATAAAGLLPVSRTTSIRSDMLAPVRLRSTPRSRSPTGGRPASSQYGELRRRLAHIRDEGRARGACDRWEVSSHLCAWSQTCLRFMAALHLAVLIVYATNMDRGIDAAASDDSDYWLLLTAMLNVAAMSAFGLCKPVRLPDKNAATSIRLMKADNELKRLCTACGATWLCAFLQLTLSAVKVWRTSNPLHYILAAGGGCALLQSLAAALAIVTLRAHVDNWARCARMPIDDGRWRARRAHSVPHIVVGPIVPADGEALLPPEDPPQPFNGERDRAGDGALSARSRSLTLSAAWWLTQLLAISQIVAVAYCWHRAIFIHVTARGYCTERYLTSSFAMGFEISGAHQGQAAPMDQIDAAFARQADLGIMLVLSACCVVSLGKRAASPVVYAFQVLTQVVTVAALCYNMRFVGQHWRWYNTGPVSILAVVTSSANVACIISRFFVLKLSDDIYTEQ